MIKIKGRDLHAGFYNSVSNTQRMKAYKNPDLYGVRDRNEDLEEQMFGLYKKDGELRCDDDAIISLGDIYGYICDVYENRDSVYLVRYYLVLCNGEKHPVSEFIANIGGISRSRGLYKVVDSDHLIDRLLFRPIKNYFNCYVFDMSYKVSNFKINHKKNRNCKK